VFLEGLAAVAAVLLGPSFEERLADLSDSPALFAGERFYLGYSRDLG